jgi:hypothetical protein
VRVGVTTTTGFVTTADAFDTAVAWPNGLLAVTWTRMRCPRSPATTV